MNSSIPNIVIRQNRESTAWFRLEPPKWQYVSPTPQLKQQGLTPTKLREIVDSINQTAEDTYNLHVFVAGYGRVVIMVFGFGFVVGTFVYFWICPYLLRQAIFILIPALFLIGVLGWWVQRTDENATSSASERIRKEVEDTLNEEWQHSHGIRWDIVTESRSTVSRNDDGSTSARTTWYYDIAVRSLKVPMVPVAVVPSPVL